MMSDWNRQSYPCVICGRQYDDFIGGSYFCSVACRAEYERWLQWTKREKEGEW